MKEELRNKLESAKYFVCSDCGIPKCVKFTWLNAKKTNADYIDAFDYTGKPVVVVARNENGDYVDDF